jgi:hypothetical protein
VAANSKNNLKCLIFSSIRRLFWHMIMSPVQVGGGKVGPMMEGGGDRCREGCHVGSAHESLGDVG